METLKKSKRVDSTEEARKVIDELREFNGELMFHQSGGCCDGSSPMCYLKDEFKVGNQDVYLGTVHGAEFYMSKDQFEYWKHTHLTLDVTKGRGASFSLEIPMGIRFIIRSRLFEENEANNLEDIRYGKGE
ncbi:MAG: DUF779 domain-containing protein [Cyclobacteriaceae bacterium]|nr:DUF779 domain-containing protein [Cyclobacteriaceae bacterium]MCH8515772.1 DUF779 domain-containing protein [Cyclobacteriaceae bacterium]